MTNPTNTNSENTGPEPQYDPHIAPAETAARREREGQNFGSKPKQSGDFDTRAGETIDQEGLANNYAIEPEMYVDQPGDLKQEEEAQKAARAQELDELSEDEEGELTKEKDTRHRGPGAV